jgi:hypothetical protein
MKHRKGSAECVLHNETRDHNRTRESFAIWQIDNHTLDREVLKRRQLEMHLVVFQSRKWKPKTFLTKSLSRSKLFPFFASALPKVLLLQILMPPRGNRQSNESCAMS